MYENDKGLNDFLFGCSDNELKKFLDNLDKCTLAKQKLIINKIVYSNRMRIVDLIE